VKEAVYVVPKAVPKTLRRFVHLKMSGERALVRKIQKSLENKHAVQGLRKL